MRHTSNSNAARAIMAAAWSLMVLLAGSASAARPGMAGAPEHRYRVGGLCLSVQDEEGPALMMNGGAYRIQRFSGTLSVPYPLVLGGVSTGGKQPFAGQSPTDVANRMTFGEGPAALHVTASRICPAVLLESQADGVRLFVPLAPESVESIVKVQCALASQVGADAYRRFAPPPGGAVKPLRWATPGPDGKVLTGVLDDQKLPDLKPWGLTPAASQAPAAASAPPLAELGNTWLLLWYGCQSPFPRSPTPFAHVVTPYLHPAGPTPLWPSLASVYQADAPILLVMSKAPRAISHEPDSGVSLSFDGAMGRMAVLPLLGFGALPAEQTEAWLKSFPREIAARCARLAAAVAEVPVDVSESVAYDRSADTVTLRQQFSFVTVRPGGVKQAPLPPMVALARSQGLPVQVSPAPVDTGLVTEYGPWVLAEGDQCAWSLQGLERYVAQDSPAGGASDRTAALEQELTAEVDKLLEAGHLAPYLYTGRSSRNDTGYGAQGTAYWYDPSEPLYLLAELLPVLPPDRQQKLRDYLRAERTKYPPERIVRLNTRDGARREWHDNSWYAQGFNTIGFQNNMRVIDAEFAELDARLIYRAYGLARYFQALGAKPDAAALTFADAALAESLRNRQWDSLGWFWNSQYSRRRAGEFSFQYTPRCVNRDLAGLVGYLRMLAAAGHEAAPEARGQYARLAALRFALSRYGRFMAEAGVYGLPAEADLVRRLQLWDDFTRPEAFVFQVQELNQYGVVLSNGASPSTHGTFGSYQIALQDIVPEVARMMRDWGLGQDVRRYLDRYAVRQSDWYRTEAGSIDGNEWRYAFPGDSYQLFMAHAWIAGTPADRLERFIDTPWMNRGDLYYMHKLAETIKTARAGK